MYFTYLTYILAGIFMMLSVTPAYSKVVEQGIDHAKVPVGVIIDDLVSIGYSGREKLVYDVSWSGGIKIGELHMEINAIPDTFDAFEIRVLVTTKNGAVHYFYPIEDLHVTKVKGSKKLPYHYEIWQNEGYNYEAHSEYHYDQVSGTIRYIKNGNFQNEYKVGGEVNNEFSSFLNSRLMEFNVGKYFIVPTFADKKKVDVEVNVVAKKFFKKSAIGPVVAAEIFPVLKFKGLYKKKGDTVIWYSDDECRVPIKVNSKIVIGSLTAELSEYENFNCKKYASFLKQGKQNNPTSRKLLEIAE